MNERRSGRENFQLWQEELRHNLASCARILEPVYVEYDETFTVSQAQLEGLRAEGDEIDLYLVRYRVPGIDGLGKPVSMIDTSCTAVDVVAFTMTEVCLLIWPMIMKNTISCWFISR